MSFEEYKSDVSSERSTPDSHGSRGKENGVSTQICGFEVSRASRPAIRLFKQSELSVKGSSLLSRQLWSPASSSDASSSDEGPKLPRIRTPRRKLHSTGPKDEFAKELRGQKKRMETIDGPVGAILITSL